MAHVTIRRCNGNTDAWAAALEPSGYLIGTSHSLDELVARVATGEAQTVTLLVQPSEATRVIDRYIAEEQAALEEARARLESGRRILARYQRGRAAILDRVACGEQ